MAVFECPFMGLARQANYYWAESGLNFYMVLLNNSTSLNKATSTIIEVLSLEPLCSTGYARQQVSFDLFVNDTSKVTAPTVSATFTAGSLPVQYDRVMVLESGSPVANSEVSSISSSTITVAGMGPSTGDKLFFTNGVNDFPTGITGSTLLYAVNAVPDSTTSTFQVSSTPGGSPISLGESWSGTLVARYANGYMLPWLLRDPDSVGNRTVTIQPGQSKPVEISLSYA